MCEECRIHKVDCIRLMIERARPDQIRRLIRDILKSGDAPDGRPA